MPDDVNNLDTNDIGLKGIFGDRFTDATAQAPGKPKTVSKPSNTTQTEKAAQKPAQKPVNDSQWEPVKPDPNWFDKLKATAKNSCPYAFLSVILFWWQQTGRLEETTAWYALLFCVGMVFFTIGRIWSGAVK